MKMLIINTYPLIVVASLSWAKKFVVFWVEISLIYAYLVSLRVVNGEWVVECQKCYIFLYLSTKPQG